MAYYTITHYLQNGAMNGGADTNAINPKDLTPQVFDAIYCKGDIEANGGDTLKDANFETEVANAAILGLTRFENFVEETYENLENLRGGKLSEFDALFENAYSEMKFRDVLRFGYHILQKNGDYYVAHVSEGIHRDLIVRYIRAQLLLLSPICPHICEKIWKGIGEKRMIVNESYPIPSATEDLIQTLQSEDLCHRGRARQADLGFVHFGQGGHICHRRLRQAMFALERDKHSNAQ